MTGKLLTIFFIFLAASPVTVASTGELSSFDHINREKKNFALELTDPIQRCLVREDTGHAVFNGCIDWHSSVHATWALIAYTKVTDDTRYLSLIKKTLDQAGLDEERKLLQGSPEFEMPYGRAWFLRLCIDYGKLFGDDLLVEFGDEVAESLVKFYSSKPPNPLDKSYKNPTWALLNLLDYGIYRNRPDMVEFVEKIVNKHYYKESASCQFEDSRPNFMSICTNWAWLVGSVVDKESFAPWVYSFMPPDKLADPIKRPKKVHEYGLNFSRSWGLLRIYQFSGHGGYLEAFTNSFLESYLNRSHWDGDYRKVGHWVAQFGMYALIPLFTDRPHK